MSNNIEEQEQTPPEQAQKSGNTLKQKKLIIVIFGVAVLVFVIYIFAQLAGLVKKKNTPVNTPTKTAAVVKKRNQKLNSLLKSFKTEIQKRNMKMAKVEVRQRRREKLKKNKIKLNTKMAVFVYIAKPKVEAAVYHKKLKPVVSYNNGIPPGTTVYADLINAVFSYNALAPAKAELLQDIYSNTKKIILPKGSMFLGQVSTIHSQNRVNITFSQVVLPDGETYSVKAIALSNNGSGGIKGQVSSPALMDALEGTGEAVLGLGSIFFGGNNANPYSMNDQLRYAAGTSLTNQAANSLANAQSNNKTTITVKAGKTIKIMFLNGFKR
ncbi:MAG: TrbI/VirB10 family protein [Deltaproteobacteria bacterium]|nr:TrbI/VirB10 family protein [Deltaproteobacteria bacterium]MCL5891874.1 TrbI/VirB10 family protein [Deltaproteobacteria bacterium]